MAVVVMAIREDGGPSGEVTFMHTTCFDDMVQAVYQAEKTALFQVGIGTVGDLWVAMTTEDDEEAGLT